MTTGAVDLSAYREPLEVARGLARLGVPLFVAESRGGGRFYLPSEWQRTVADETVVDRWRPGMALCAVTGVVFDVIDVDPRNEGLASFQVVEPVMPFVYGYVTTPSGGWHAWVKTLGLRKRSGFRAGVDFQGGAPDGEGRGFVYLPPTTRPSKMTGEVGEYRWTSSPLERAAYLRGDDTGAALREMISAAREVGGGGDSDYTDPDLDPLLRGGIPAGQAQDVTLRDVVWKLMLAGQGDELIKMVWRTIVSLTPLTRDEPWTDADLDRHLERARQKLGKPLTAAERLELISGMSAAPAAGDGGGGDPGDAPPPVVGPEIPRWYLDLIEEDQTWFTRAQRRRFDQETDRITRADNEARERAREAALISAVDALDGETFIFKEIIEVEAFWSRGTEVLWPKDEGLMISGPQGVGKTTIIQNLLLRRVGIGDGPLYGFPVTVDEDEDAVYLYLAMDRPAQARRSIRRMVADNPVDRKIVASRLRFWSGPLPINVLGRPEALLDWATAYCGGRVPAAIFCDSYKDLAVGLSKDDVGAAINLMVQSCIAGGSQWVGAHHHRKQAGAGAGEQRHAPRSIDDVYGSTWLTSGLGSVLMLWGETGDPAVELTQLKEPSDKINPLRLLHDPVTGWLSVDEEENVDPVDVIRRRGEVGITAPELALELYGDAGRRSRALRTLRRLVADHVVTELPPVVTGGRGRPTPRFRLSSFDLPAGPSAADLNELLEGGDAG